MTAPDSDVTQTVAYRTLVAWAKAEYQAKQRGMSQKALKGHDLKDWLVKWLNRKFDVSFSLHDPRDLSVKDAVMPKLVSELTEWKDIGKRDTPKFPE